MTTPLNVLVACEESQEVTAAFIAFGHNAMSCDLLPGAKGLPHYQGDVFDLDFSKFDLVIAHPPCTYIANSGNRWHAGTLARCRIYLAGLEYSGCKNGS